LSAIYNANIFTLLRNVFAQLEKILYFCENIFYLLDFQ